MKDYTLDEYKEALGRSEGLLNHLCSDLKTFGNDGNKFKISISGYHKNGRVFVYGIPDYLLIVIRDAIENYASKLKEIIDYYDRHAIWIEIDNMPYGFNCGNCGRFSYMKSEYCPHCGFKMDKKFGSDKAKEIYTKIMKAKLKFNLVKE